MDGQHRYFHQESLDGAGVRYRDEDAGGVQPVGRPVLWDSLSNSGKVMIFAGGVPLKRGGQVVGAIGVSGGTGEQDQTVAEAGAAAF